MKNFNKDVIEIARVVFVFLLIFFMVKSLGWLLKLLIN